MTDNLPSTPVVDKPMSIADLNQMQWFLSSMDEGCKCQFNHVNTVCSGAVTHRLVSCYADPLLCAVATEFQRARSLVKDAKCAGCNGLSVECWRFIPV